MSQSLVNEGRFPHVEKARSLIKENGSVAIPR